MAFWDSIGVSELITIGIGIFTLGGTYIDLKKRIEYTKDDVDKAKTYATELNEEMNKKFDALVKKYDTELSNMVERYEKINSKLENDIKEKISELKVNAEKTHRAIFNRLDEISKAEYDTEKKLSEVTGKLKSLDSRINTMYELERKLSTISVLTTKLEYIEKALDETRQDFKHTFYKQHVGKRIKDDNHSETNN